MIQIGVQYCSPQLRQLLTYGNIYEPHVLQIKDNEHLPENITYFVYFPPVVVQHVVYRAVPNI